MLHGIHVFIASPGDLAVEWRAFKDVIDELNAGFADGAGVRFVALGWEDTLATTGRAQGVINRDIDRSDVFVLALHRRWGQEAPDAKPYTSYTEEEFHRALDRWTKTGSSEIFVFFKHIDPGQMADPGPQLEKVLAFRKSLEDSRQVLYRSFADEKAFTAEVDRHLRACAKDELGRGAAARVHPGSHEGQGGGPGGRGAGGGASKARRGGPRSWRWSSPSRRPLRRGRARSSRPATRSPRSMRGRPTYGCCLSPTSSITAAET